MGLFATNAARKASQDVSLEAGPRRFRETISGPDRFSILIVENDDADALAVRRILEQSRYGDAHVCIVNDQQAARGALGEQDFDLVISDFWIGNKTSISLINEISERTPHLPVIMLSSHPRAVISNGESVESLVYLSRSHLSPRLLEAIIAAALSAAAGDNGS